MRRRVALIGHRGVGKTSLLARIGSYLEPHVPCLDLDREIRGRSGLDIQEVFATQGEEAFRNLEREIFAAIDKETQDVDVYLAIGAGFDPAQIPASWLVLWIRRSTDEAGRIFMDRPRLNASVAALEEFQERYESRQSSYRARADQTLWLDEGIEETFDPAERQFFKNEIKDLRATITLLPEVMGPHFSLWAQQRIQWGASFELRDDLLSESQFAKALENLPHDRLLVSFRDRARMAKTADFVRAHDLAFDWPFEFGESVFQNPRIVSLHERRESESITQALTRLTSQNASALKAALPTRSLDELLEGEKWQKADPSRRVFLPHSPDGRWAWYRLHQLSRQPLSFIREGEGSGKDQPTLLQAAREPREAPNFAAVLGDPVKHSRTPMEHREFFAPQSPVYTIRITAIEMREGALEKLKSLGLKWAAVTAPLKELACAACTQVDETARKLSAVNTLHLGVKGIEGANTDLPGLASATSHFDFGQIAVWGGGGTLNVLRELFPSADFYSLRSGERRDPSETPAQLPNTVIWAVGRTNAGLNEPPPEWKPERVVDLNYADDSPGRAFALARGAKYISGLAMFRAQAEAQRQFWQSLGDRK